jgi:PAS domain S-box-containing protein
MIETSTSASHSGNRPAEAAEPEGAARAGFTALSADDRKRLMEEATRDCSIFITDADDRIIVWSDGAEKLFGFSDVEALGKKPEALLLFRAPPSAEIRSELSTAGAEPATISLAPRCKDGRQLWCACRRKAAVGESGAKVAWHVFTDNTEQKHTEESLRATIEFKERLLANVSHELRTPLSAILLWAQLFEEQSTIDPDQLREGLDVIRKSAIEQRELIEDLIDTVRISQGKLRLERAPADLCHETRCALDIARSAARQKEIELYEQIDPALGVALVDPHRWKQIFWNLLSNAVKFTSHGGRIDFSIQRSGETVAIRVADTGKGISPEFLPSIFERFGQADGSTKRAHSGLGLGLGITRELVRLHGGTISAESAGLGRGAVFTVLLPLPEINPSMTSSAPPPRGSFAGVLSSKKILLVEDSAQTREALAAVLSVAGAQVTAMATASAALYEFRSNPPHLLISDLGLPHMDGNDLIIKVRSMEKMLRREPVPALVLTAYAGDLESRRAIQCGFTHYMTKPVEPVKLIEVLRSLLT